MYTLSDDIRYTLEHITNWDAVHTNCLWCALLRRETNPGSLKTVHALLVGVNDETLTGPARDVYRVNSHLQKHCDIYNTTLLINQKATKANILRNFQDLVNNLKENDTGIFHFSGHGTSITNDDLASDDGKDEVILSHDLQFIRDDQIFSLLQQVPTSCKMILIFDNCSSATMADIPRMFWLNKHRELQQRNANDNTIAAKVIVISASGDGENAYELGGTGVLTSALMKSLLPGRSILETLKMCDTLCRPVGQVVHISLSSNVGIQHPLM